MYAGVCRVCSWGAGVVVGMDSGCIIILRMTGSVVGVAVLWVCVLHIILKELVLIYMYVSMYVYVMLFHV